MNFDLPALANNNGRLVFVPPTDLVQCRVVVVEPGCSLRLVNSRPSFSLQITNMQQEQEQQVLAWKVTLDTMHKVQILPAYKQGFLTSQETATVELFLSTEDRDALLILGEDIKSSQFHIFLGMFPAPTIVFPKQNVLPVHIRGPIHFMLPPVGKSTAYQLYSMSKERHALYKRVRRQDYIMDFSSFQQNFASLKPLGSKEFMHEGYCSLCKVDVEKKYGAKSQRSHRAGRQHVSAYVTYVQTWRLEFNDRFTDLVTVRKSRVLQEFHSLCNRLLRSYIKPMAKNREFASQLFLFVHRITLRVTTQISNAHWTISQLENFATVEETAKLLYLQHEKEYFPNDAFGEMLCEQFVNICSETVWELIKPWI